MTLDCGARLRRHDVAYRTYGTLNADAHQRGAGLPCADRRSICRRDAPAHRQARLVGRGRRAGPADRHRPLLRHLRQRAGRLHGQHRPAQPRDARHAARGAPTSRPSPSATWSARRSMLIDQLGISRLFAVLGGSMGGMQALEWAASYPGRGVRRRCRSPRAPITRRRTSRSTRSGGRRSSPIPTGRAGATGHRPGPGPRPRGRADVRAHHLSVGSRR